MAFFLDYITLKETIVSYLQNNSPAIEENLDLFIMLAQRRCAKDAKILGVENYSQLQTTNTVAILIKPTGWRNTLSFFIEATNQPLLLRSYEYCLLYNQSNSIGAPVYYSDYGFDRWLLSPTPDRAYNLTCAYFSLPPLIDATSTTNWFTINAPECLLYACLYEAAFFLKNDTLMPIYQQLYQQSMDALNQENTMRIHDRFDNRAAD